MTSHNNSSIEESKDRYKKSNSSFKLYQAESS